MVTFAIGNSEIIEVNGQFSSVFHGYLSFLKGKLQPHLCNIKDHYLLLCLYALLHHGFWRFV